jgi:hypothetical protein
VPPGLIFGVARDVEPQDHVVGERVAHLVGGHLEEASVARAGASDQDMVDATGNGIEESRHRGWIGGVEGGGGPCADLARRVLETLSRAAGEDHVGPLGTCQPGGLQSDASAAANHDDGLPQQVRFMPGDRSGCGGHRSSSRREDCHLCGGRSNRLRPVHDLHSGASNGGVVDPEEAGERLDRVAEHLECDMRADR